MDILSLLSNQVFLAPVLLAIDEFGLFIPIGDLLVIYVGYQVSRGSISLITAFLILFIAVIIGATALYYVFFHFGKRVLSKVEKYIHINEKKLKAIEKKFLKYGPLVIIFGRHVPGFRIPITIFSGVSKIPFPTFIISVGISTVFWLAFYLSIGMKLGPKALHLFHAHQNYYLFLVVPIIIILIGYFYLRSKKK